MSYLAMDIREKVHHSMFFPIPPSAANIGSKPLEVQFSINYSGKISTNWSCPTLLLPNHRRNSPRH